VTHPIIEQRIFARASIFKEIVLNPGAVLGVNQIAAIGGQGGIFGIAIAAKGWGDRPNKKRLRRWWAVHLVEGETAGIVFDQPESASDLSCFFSAVSLKRFFPGFSCLYYTFLKALFVMFSSLLTWKVFTTLLFGEKG
jgi:hypothetical protein